MIRSLFKRSGKYFLGLAASRIVSTLLFIILARRFPPTIFGELVFYWTLLQLVTSLSDFGLIQWYQKKAHETDNKDSLFQLMLSARSLMLLVSMILSALILSISHLFNISTLTIFLLTLIPEAYLSIIDAYYFDRHESPKVATKNAVRMTLALLGYIIAWHYLNYFIVLWVIFVSACASVLWYMPWQKFRGYAFDSFSTIIKALRSSSNYAYLIITSYAYARGDSIIIRVMRGSSAIGFYGAAYRYLESLALLPTALQHNLFPISAKAGSISSQQLKKIIGIMAGVGILTGVALFFLSDFLVVRLLGPLYVSAIVPLRIFSLVVFLFFINSPLATIVQSSDFIKKFLPFGIGNTVLNLVLNIIFVPVYGINAAAWVMLITELSGLIINLYFVKKVYEK